MRTRTSPIRRLVGSLVDGITRMDRSSTSVPWHEAGIRISAHGISAHAAELDRAIPPSEVRDVFIRQSWLSPVALVAPFLSLLIGGRFFVLFFRPHGLPWWCLLLPTWFIAHAAHTVCYFCRARRNAVFVSAPAVAPGPILIHVTESAQEAAELILAIEAVTRERTCLDESAAQPGR